MAPKHWQPNRATESAPRPLPPLFTAIGRGLAGRCPACGNSRLFAGFLRLAPACPRCGAPLAAARADDAPPYFTIFIVGHIVVPLMLLVDRIAELSALAMAAIFLPLSLVLALALLRPVKGGTVGAIVSLNLLPNDAERA